MWGLLAGAEGWEINLFFLGCVLLAGLYGAAAASRKSLFVQALPAAIGLALVLLTYNSCFTMELSVQAPVAEWDGEEVRLPLEKVVAFTAQGCRLLAGRQTNSVYTITNPNWRVIFMSLDENGGELLAELASSL